MSKFMAWVDDFNEAFMAGEVSMSCEICGERYYVNDNHECDPKILEDYINWLDSRDSESQKGVML
jgi:hypothetical protein